MAVSKKEVVSAAVQLERDGRKFYLDAARKASSIVAKQMFQSLADDEVRHIAWIEKAVPGARSARRVNQDLYKRLSHIFADVPEMKRRDARMAQSDEAALDLAIDMETRSRDAYEKWAGEMDSRDVRDLCLVLAGAEGYHKSLLENTREYLKHSTGWFLQDTEVVESS